MAKRISKTTTQLEREALSRGERPFYAPPYRIGDNFDPALDARMRQRAIDFEVANGTWIGCDDIETCGHRWPASSVSNPIGEICPKCGKGKIIRDPGPSKPAQRIAERRAAEGAARKIEKYSPMG